MGDPTPEHSRIRPLRILVLVSLVGLGLLGWIRAVENQAAVPPASLDGGYALPSFELPVLNVGLFQGDTTTISSGELRGQVLLVSFWATWCQPCIEEQPSLLALQDEFGNDGLQVIGVLHDDRPRGALTWLTDNDRTAFRILVGTEDIARRSRVGRLPHTLLVGRSGQVAEVFYGYWSGRDAYVKERVKELLAKPAA